MNKMNISVTFQKNSLGFENLKPLLDYLYPYYLEMRSEIELALDWEHSRYFFPVDRDVQSPKQSITSSVGFSERIRFYQFSKVQYPVFFLCDVLATVAENQNDDRRLEVSFYNLKDTNEAERMFLKTLTERIQIQKPKNLVLNFENNADYFSTTNGKREYLTQDLHWDSALIKEKFQFYISLGMHEDAIRLGNLYLQRHPENYEMHMFTGLAYVLFDMPEKGEDKYLHVLEHSNDPKLIADIYYCLAMLYMRHNDKNNLDFEKSQQYLELGRKTIQHNKEALGLDYTYLFVFNRNGRALAEFKKGNFELAHQYCEDGHRTLFKAYGSEPHILHRSVLIYNCTLTSKALRNDLQTKLYYDLLLTIDPYYPDYWYDKFKFESRIGDLENAEFSINRALELNPYNSSYYIEKAEFLTQYAYPQSAIEDSYSKALKINPMHEEALVNYSAFLLEHNKNEAVIELLSSRKAFLSADAKSNLALAYLNVEDTDRAIALYESLLADAPKADWLANLSVCYYSQQRHGAALKSINDAMEHDPDNPSYIYNKAFLLKELYSIEEASRYIQKVKETYKEENFIEELSQLLEEPANV